MYAAAVYTVREADLGSESIEQRERIMLVLLGAAPVRYPTMCPIMTNDLTPGQKRIKMACFYNSFIHSEMEVY